MEDAIDDWIVRQIHWLRREDIIAQGIRWVQDVSIKTIEVYKLCSVQTLKGCKSQNYNVLQYKK